MQKNKNQAIDRPIEYDPIDFVTLILSWLTLLIYFLNAPLFVVKG